MAGTDALAEMKRVLDCDDSADDAQNTSEENQAESGLPAHAVADVEMSINHTENPPGDACHTNDNGRYFCYWDLTLQGYIFPSPTKTVWGALCIANGHTTQW